MKKYFDVSRGNLLKFLWCEWHLWLSQIPQTLKMTCKMTGKHKILRHKEKANEISPWRSTEYYREHFAIIEPLNQICRGFTSKCRGNMYGYVSIITQYELVAPPELMRHSSYISITGDLSKSSLMALISDFLLQERMHAGKVSQFITEIRTYEENDSRIFMNQNTIFSFLLSKYD